LTTNVSVEFYLFLPQMRMAFDDIVSKAQAAEASGFRGVTFMDHMVPPLAASHPMHEGFITATVVAARTDQLRVGHLVLCDSFRHPALLAREALALDHASGGRFDLGIGSGSVVSEFEPYGIPTLTGPDRVRRLDETLQVVRALWSGQTVDFDGEFHHLHGATMAPTPLSQIPIVIGGSGPATMALVARHADWWNLPVHRLDHFEELRSRAGAARVSLQQMVAFVDTETDRASVTELAQRRFPNYGGGLVIGNADELCTHFATIADRGVERFYLWFADFAAESTLRMFGERVISALVQSP
jgi:alkanesulfonate monooxygenase SsuD/methylene tetrahydromethanopterin reductase-like flavin-dependent oxidoreductase (luciferase family)